MIRQQRWTPDTCADSATGDACSFIETWDDSVPVEERTHTLQKAEKQCSRHVGLKPEHSYVRAVVENRAVAANPHFHHSHIVSTAKKGEAWQVDLGKNMTPDQKTQLQSHVDNHFGAGKVLVS